MWVGEVKLQAAGDIVMFKDGRAGCGSVSNMAKRQRTRSVYNYPYAFKPRFLKRALSVAILSITAFVSGMLVVSGKFALAPRSSRATTAPVRYIFHPLIPDNCSADSNKLKESTTQDSGQGNEDFLCGYRDKVNIDSVRVPNQSNRSSTPCLEKPSSLIGRFAPVMDPVLHHELAAMFVGLQDGGHYTPRLCTPIEKIAILIPYRNRCRHLYTLLPNLIPMLMRQNVEFTIFVIEQVTAGSFNKGILFNAGYLEALKLDNYDCFILHDVDMIPSDDRNMYGCNEKGPIHFASAINKFNYSVEYEELFGGVVSFTREQFRLINGASNLYFGWGAEDDDLRNRAVNRKMTLLRKNHTYAFYDMIKHNTSEGFEPNPDRRKVFGTGRARQRLDGLNSLVYRVARLRTSVLYTWLEIDFDAAAILSAVPEKLRMGNAFNESFLYLKFKELS